MPKITPPTGPKPSIGVPIDLSAEQTDQAAEVTPIDVAAARALWTRAAPPRFIDLLDAVPEEGFGKRGVVDDQA